MKVNFYGVAIVLGSLLFLGACKLTPHDPDNVPEEITTSVTVSSDGNVVFTIAWPTTPAESRNVSARTIPPGATDFFLVLWEPNTPLIKRTSVAYPLTSVSLAVPAGTYYVYGLFTAGTTPLALGKASTTLAVSVGSTSTVPLTVKPVSDLITATFALDPGAQPVSAYMYGNWIKTTISLDQVLIDVFNSYPRHSSDIKLVTLYQDGVGTPSIPFTTIQNSAFLDGTANTFLNVPNTLISPNPEINQRTRLYQSQFNARLSLYFLVDFWGVPLTSGTFIGNPAMNFTYSVPLTGVAVIPVN
jgi:hypothetical protein